MSQLRANVLLNLPKKFNTLVLYYNTYEKATFDQYLSASIALRSKNLKKAYEYIDDITGKGSLNEHFKHMVSETLKMDDESLNNVLNDSMFPVTKIDRTNKYVYYPLFNVAVLNNKIYDNFEGRDILTIKELLMIDYELKKIEIDKNGENEKYESYKIRFINKDVEINIANTWLPFDSLSFSNYCKKQDIEIERYQGIIHLEVEGDDWNLLTNNSFNSLFSSNKCFLDSNYDYCMITNDYIKRTKIAKVHGLYFYKDDRLDFNKANKDYCELAIKSLLDNSQINETKTKTLLAILKIVDDLIAQNIVNFVLTRKESKEISLFGLELIRKGIEKNWEIPTLKSIKSYASSSELNLIYNINSNLDYSLSELSRIDNNLLTVKHLETKQKYLSERNNKIEEIEKKLGAISGSALRQNGKKVLKQSNPDVKKFNKLCNKMFAHNEVALADMSDIQLDNKYKEVNEFYDLYLSVKKMYDELS